MNLPDFQVIYDLYLWCSTRGHFANNGTANQYLNSSLRSMIMGPTTGTLPVITATKKRSGSLRANGIIALCIICSILIIQGLFLLIQYETTPGDIGATPAAWPEDSFLAPSEELPTLVLFAHPRCPCTRATVGELDLLMTHSQGKVATHVMFFTPDNAPDDWSLTDLWQAAERIPGVVVHRDIDGIESQRFGAETSGFSVLYDLDNQLVFRGGITASRGHAGNNAGRAAIHSLLQGKSTDIVQCFVFGCSLLDPPSQHQK